MPPSRTPNTDSPRRWTQISADVPAAAADAVADALLDLGATGIAEEYPELTQGGPAVSTSALAPPPPAAREGVTLLAYLPGDVPAASLIDPLLKRLRVLDEVFAGLANVEVHVEAIEEKDWGKTWRAHYEAVEVGRSLLVRPSWKPATGGHDRLEVIIDPSMAFGTGTHFTTVGCLEALEDALDGRPGATVLDLGTGTGILAIAAARLGADSTLGVDTDPEAVVVAQRNLEINGVQQSVTVRHGDLAGVDGTFDVVLANILAPVLCDLAGELAAHMNPGASLVVSGLLVDQEEEVRRALTAAGVEISNRRSDGEWVALEATLSS
jgi:ribosomal protein L11 methyltransferase